MNDAERELWVLNDEGLYLFWKHSGWPKRAFIREFREMIDEHIDHAPHKRAEQREAMLP